MLKYHCDKCGQYFDSNSNFSKVKIVAGTFSDNFDVCSNCKALIDNDPTVLLNPAIAKLKDQRATAQAALKQAQLEKINLAKANTVKKETVA